MNAMTMGQSAGPEPTYHPGDVSTPAVLVGHMPSVLATVHTGRMGRVDDVVGRISIFLVFVMWVVVPVLGILGILLG